MSRRTGIALVATACVVPRLAVLLAERGRVLSAYQEKSDRFASVFVHHGTFGLVPGEPSAYTQPLYGWFLIPVYGLFGRNWVAVGLAQVAVALATALLVRAAAARVVRPTAATAAAVVATLNPYLLWHDMHLNREILDQLAAAGLVVLTVAAAERRSLRLSAATGVVAGIAILGNVRLALLPVLLAAFLAWHLGDRRRALLGAALVLVLGGAAVTPWLVRNRVEVGCWTLTTDSRALWKANNPATERVLAAGGWIDNVPPLRGAPAYTPEAAGDVYATTGRRIAVDECAQMRLYQHAVLTFWRRHPGEKTALVADSLRRLWNPAAAETVEGRSAGKLFNAFRRWGEGSWMTALYALAFAGFFLIRRSATALILLLLVYQSAAAAVFVGTTRYRIVWDFLLAIPAAAAATWAAERWRSRATVRGLVAE